MPHTWGDIERELLANRLPTGQPNFDGVRRKYLKDLAAYSGRSCIVYETAGFNPPQSATSPSDLQIALDPDMGAFMEAVTDLPIDVPLDLILHSPGGSADAAEAIIHYLRGRFPGLRVIVPVAAKSAATMMAMAADEIVMAAHSQLGPIDPQLTIQTPDGPRSAPAAAIQKQFQAATEDLAKNPGHVAAWLPILRSMSPALLQICANVEQLSRTMVKDWLVQYMFHGDERAEEKADAITDYLSNYDEFMSHGRLVTREELRKLEIPVVDLEDDQTLQDLVLAVHHCINHTMNQTGLFKIVESHLGKSFMRQSGTVVVNRPGGIPLLPGGPMQLPIPPGMVPGAQGPQGMPGFPGLPGVPGIQIIPGNPTVPPTSGRQPPVVPEAPATPAPPLAPEDGTEPPS